MEGKEAEGRPYLYGGSHVGGRMRAVLLRTPSAFTSALNTPRQMTVSRLRLARSCLASDTTSKGSSTAVTGGEPCSTSYLPPTAYN